MKRVLVIVPYYVPGYRAGGPIRSIQNMVTRLSEEIRFKIITSDRDFGDKGPYSTISTDRWLPVGDAEVFYAAPCSQGFSRLVKLVRETPHDVLYLNSLFHPRFAINLLLARWLQLLPVQPVLLAPRGQLSDGAMRFSTLRKRMFLTMASGIGLFREVYFQASSSYEAAEIAKKLVGVSGSQIIIAPNVPEAPQRTPRQANIVQTEYAGLQICFLSRVSPKKNIEYALRVLSSVDIPVRFDIYGPIEDRGYWRRCEVLMRVMGENVQVRYLGHIVHSKVFDMLSHYDLLFLPTLGENFGHVILESLVAGTPVLISDRTPWRDLAAAGVGWDLPLETPGLFKKAIHEAAVLAQTDVEWRGRVRAYGQGIASGRHVVAANREMFERVFGET